MEEQALNIESEDKILNTKFNNFEEKLICPICREPVEDDANSFSQEYQPLKICNACESRFSPLQVKWQNQVSLVTEDKFELERQLNAIKTLLNEKTQEIFSLRRQVEERENVIYELKETSYHKTVENQIIIDGLTISNSKLQYQIENLDKNIKKLEQTNLNLQSSQNYINNNKTKLGFEIEMKNEEIKQLNEKNDRTIKSLNSVHDKYLQTMGKLNKADSDKKMLVQKLEEYELKVSDSNLKLNNTINELNNLQKKSCSFDEYANIMKVDMISSSIDTIKDMYSKIESAWYKLLLMTSDNNALTKQYEDKTENLITNLLNKINSQEHDLEMITNKVQQIESDFTFVYREYAYISGLIMSKSISIENIESYLENSFPKVRSHIENINIVNFEILDHEKVKCHPLYKEVNKKLQNAINNNKQILESSEKLQHDIQLLKNEIKIRDGTIENYKEKYEEIKALKEFVEIENKLLQEQVTKILDELKILKEEKENQNKTKEIKICKLISYEIKSDNDLKNQISPCTQSLHMDGETPINPVTSLDPEKNLVACSKDENVEGTLHSHMEKLDKQNKSESECEYESLLQFSSPEVQVLLLQVECAKLIDKKTEI